MLEAAVFFRGWPVLMTSSLRQFCKHILKYTFFSAIQYIVFKKQPPVESAHEVSADSSEIVYDEAHFIR